MSFTFKQFSVVDTNSAMKVGTDGVIIGMWGEVPQKGRVLDIGCGSGLISLIVAQRTDSNVVIDAIDIEKGAIDDAKLNFSNSEWGDRISAINVDFNIFQGSTQYKYDAIISNPPYFINSLLPSNSLRATARHTTNFSYNQLFAGVSNILSDMGAFSTITPADCYQEVALAALQSSLYLKELTWVIPVAGKSPNRVLCKWRTTLGSYTINRLVMRGVDGEYTPEYRLFVGELYGSVLE